MNGWLGGISRKGRLRSFATLTEQRSCFPGASRVKGSVAEGVCEPLQLYTEGGEGAAAAAARGGLEILGTKKATIRRWWLSS